MRPRQSRGRDLSYTRSRPRWNRGRGLVYLVLVRGVTEDQVPGVPSPGTPPRVHTCRTPPPSWLPVPRVQCRGQTGPPAMGGLPAACPDLGLSASVRSFNVIYGLVSDSASITCPDSQPRVTPWFRRCMVLDETSRETRSSLVPVPDQSNNKTSPRRAGYRRAEDVSGPRLACLARLGPDTGHDLGQASAMTSVLTSAWPQS